MRKRRLKIGRARRSSAPGQRKTALYSIGDELWGSGIRSDFPITVQGTFGPKDALRDGRRSMLAWNGFFVTIS